MKPDILDKLRAEMSKPIRSERQVVYILVEIRKLLEITESTKKYFALNFYCSWAVRPWMKREGARRIIERFDKVHRIANSQGRDAVPLKYTKKLLTPLPASGLRSRWTPSLPTTSCRNA